MRKNEITNSEKEYVRSKNKLSPFWGTALINLLVLTVTALLSFIVYIWLLKSQIIKEQNVIWFIVTLILSSLGLSFVLLRSFGRKVIYGYISPIKDISKSTAEGDFSKRLYVPKDKYASDICKSFNEMLDSLNSNELIARDFLSNVSHQFRTPLASIRGYAQLLESKDLSEAEKLEYISVIEEKSMSLSELVTDILELSRLEHQSSDISKEYFSVDEQIRKCLIALESKISEKNIDIELNLNSVNFFGNKELLKEVWNNLLENAIKFSNKNGIIKISLDSSFDNLVFVIADNGIGMSLETSLRIYDRFYRGKEATEYTGSGLGMSMVKDIITKHDGTISVRSELEKGTEFTVTIPLE